MWREAELGVDHGAQLDALAAEKVRIAQDLACLDIRNGIDGGVGDEQGLFRTQHRVNTFMSGGGGDRTDGGCQKRRAGSGFQNMFPSQFLHLIRCDFIV